MESIEPEIDLGPCCACGAVANVRNVIALNRRGPTPGQGWSCLQCGLPPGGAVAVVCDTCLATKAEIKFVCAGGTGSGGRVPIEACPTEKFKHRMEYHPEALQHIRWFDESPDFGHPDCICSTCGDPIPWPEDGFDPAALLHLRLFRPPGQDHPHGQEARFCGDCSRLVLLHGQFGELRRGK